MYFPNQVPLLRYVHSGLLDHIRMFNCQKFFTGDLVLQRKSNARFKILCEKTNAQFFGGIAFGTNVFLCCHTDADFTFSIIQVFLKGKSQYQPEEDVLVYFCFPTIGVAVPLRPGDYLLFNTRIPHCISSRCKFEDEIIVTSIYLKESGHAI